MKRSILFLTLFAFTSACESSSNSGTTDEVQNEISENEIGEEKLPCDLISEAEIKSICGIPDSVEGTIELKERTYSSCFYKWEEFTYNRVMEMGGMDVNIPIPAEMSIVPVKNVTDDMFETSTAVYKDGETISGLGDRAIWGTQMSQLTFLSNGQMIHLHLDVSADKTANREMAIKIATILVNNL